MPDSEIQIRTEPNARGSARKDRPSSTRFWIGVAAIAFVGLFAVVGLITSSTDEAPASRPSNSTGEAAARVERAVPDPKPVKASAIATSGEQIVEDSAGELLWSEPTAGPPISLAYVPAGTQCLVHLRPSKLAAHPEGERVLASLGPWGERAVERATDLLGSDARHVDSLLISIVVSEDRGLDVCLRAALSEPVNATQLAIRFPASEQRDHNGVSYRVENDRAWFFSENRTDGDKAESFLIASTAEMVEDLIDAGSEPPPMIRDIERLVELTDEHRMATVIVSPKFLQAGGNELLAGEAARLHEVIEWLVAGDATAIALSAHWGENFFLELQATPALNVQARRLAAKLRERAAAAPAVVEEELMAAQFPEYGRKVVARFPAMLRALSRYSRSGDSEGCALVRAYLPAMAGHNLLMAAELMLTQSQAGSADAVASAPMPPVTIEDRLDAVTSLTFSKDTLERALELLAEEAGVDITIDGAALQLEGITKNQSLAIDARNQPAEEVLGQILLRANPDRTASGPSDARQKLVYVIESGGSPGPGRIIVTTRAAAERRGGRLPDAFVLKQP